MKKQLQINTIFGELTVIKYIGSIKYNNTYLCQCTCGETRKVKLTHLLQKKVVSCGCKNFVYTKHGNTKFSPIESSFNAKATKYRALAKNRGIEFTISIEETVNLLKGHCYYCGCSPRNKYRIKNSKEYEIFYNGIDRVKNELGYIENNVVSCCSVCNTAKLTLSLFEFKEWIITVYNNFVLNDKTNLDK